MFEKLAGDFNMQPKVGTIARKSLKQSLFFSIAEIVNFSLPGRTESREW